MNGFSPAPYPGVTRSFQVSGANSTCAFTLLVPCSNPLDVDGLTSMSNVKIISCDVYWQESAITRTVHVSTQMEVSGF